MSFLIFIIFVFRGVSCNEEVFDFSKINTISWTCGVTYVITNHVVKEYGSRDHLLPTYIDHVIPLQHDKSYLNKMQAIGRMEVKRCKDKKPFITIGPNSEKIYIPENLVDRPSSSSYLNGYVNCIIHHGNVITVGDKIIHRFGSEKSCHSTPVV